MQEPFYSKRRLTRFLLLSALLLSTALSVAYLLHPPFIIPTSNRTTDAVMALADKRKSSGLIVIVDIDEESLARYGQWPWPRSTLARLLDILDASGAAAVGLDLILAEPDRTSPVQEQPGVDHGHELRASSRPADRADHDQVLARSLAAGPYVLGYEFLFGAPRERQTSCQLHPPGVVSITMPGATREPPAFFVAQGVVCNRQLFSAAVARSGFLNASPDGDGILRRVPMLIQFENHLYPSLELATLMQYTKSDQIEIVRRPGSGSLELRVDRRRITVGPQGNMIVHFSLREGEIPRVSAGDLLGGRLSPEKLSHKIVLIGSSAAGLEPTYQTFGGPIRSHVEIHAQVLDNLLTGEQIIRNRISLLWEVVVGILVAAATALAVAGMGIAASAMLSAACVAGSWLGMVLVFQGSGHLLSPLLPTVLGVLNYAALTVAKALRIQRVARRVATDALLMLTDSEKNLSSIIQAVPDIVFRLDSACRILFISPAVAKYTVSPDALLGRPIFIFMKREHRAPFLTLANDVFLGVPGNLEFEGACKARQVWFDTHVVPFRNEAGEIVSLIGVARDVTDRKFAEQALAEKQRQLEDLNANLEARIKEAVLDSRKKDQILILQGRQAAMGEMISNIAHQWRQPLNTLGLVIQELLLTYGRNEFSRESVEATVNRSMGLIMHMSKTIDDFRNYFKDQKEKVLFDVGAAVEKTLALIEPTFKSSEIAVEVTYRDDCAAHGNPSEYSQVLLNILLNARDAFESCRGERSRQIKILICKEGNRSVLKISDNAGGIPEEIMHKIFDPYFTTKDPDKGTGIGLYMAKTIIEKNMGGRLAVRNTAVGAEFTIEV